MSISIQSLPRFWLPNAFLWIPFLFSAALSFLGSQALPCHLANLSPRFSLWSPFPHSSIYVLLSPLNLFPENHHIGLCLLLAPNGKIPSHLPSAVASAIPYSGLIHGRFFTPVQRFLSLPPSELYIELQRKTRMPVLWTECFYPPKVPMLKLWFPVWWCLEIRPWAKLIPHWWDECSYLKRQKTACISSLCSWPCEETAKRWLAICKPGRETSKEPNPRHSDLRLSSLQSYEKYISVVSAT